jgi:hypothetical protein
MPGSGGVWTYVDTLVTALEPELDWPDGRDEQP